MMIKILDFLKVYYQSLFKKEAESVANLAVYKTFCLIAGSIYRFKYRNLLRRTSQFIEKSKRNNGVKEKSVFVFANGPSLEDVDLSKISKLCATGKFDLIAINSFLSKSTELVLPTYAVFADNVHFNINSIDNQYRSDVEFCEKNNITYFIPAKHYSSAIGQRFAYCDFCDIYSKNTIDILKPTGYYGVTAFFALTLAKSLGYKNIYMCGFDNSYFKDFSLSDSGRMKIKHMHYYDTENSVIEVPCLYESTSNFFFDIYRHFYFLQKITKNANNIFNLAKITYISFIPRKLDLDIYKT